MMNSTRTCVGTRVTDTGEKALEATSHALDSSRRFASDAAATVGEAVRDLRDGAADLARSGAESVTDVTVAAQRQLGRFARSTRRHVAAEPVKSALIAAAIGVGAVALVMAILRSRSGTD